ncbi:leucine-rich repeat protein [bacterium 210820-DFI.6.37]|nr:leucine-rich repeat protein [bacterium 210820-DFI.6.37]
MSNANIRLTTKVILALLIMGMFITILPASAAYAADYDHQPENAQENDTNSLKMLDPADISFVSKSDTAYTNKINETIDGTKAEGVRFTFTLRAGMSSFREAEFLERNMPQIRIYDDKGAIAAQYSEGNGDLKYLGNNGSAEKRELYIGVDQGVLDTGDYTLVFGRDICGNNTAKILNYDIIFQFHVRAAPELSVMIQQAEDFVCKVTQPDETGNDKIDDQAPGCYPQAALEALNTSIKEAKGHLGTTGEDAASEELYKALRTFKDARNFEISDFSISGITAKVAVGDSGKALASITAVPDESQYKKVIWSVVKQREDDSAKEVAADNLLVDESTGRWIAAYRGTVCIKATCVKNPKLAEYREVMIDSPEGVVAVNLPDESTRLQTLIEKTGMDINEITSVKVFTSGTGKLTAEDLAYLKSLHKLADLDLKETALETVPAEAFAGHTNLTKVALPNTVITIGDRAFSNCGKLSEIEIPSSVTKLGNSIFDGCNALQTAMKIHAVSPPEYPQNGILSSRIKTIEVPYGCAKDYQDKTGWNSFIIKEGNRQTLYVKVDAPGTLEEASAQQLVKQGITDDQVTDLVISSPEDVQLSRGKDVDTYLKTHFLNATTIDLSQTGLEQNKCNANTFRERISLKYIILPETTENIGTQSFYGCGNLREITIPKSVTSIGNAAFGECDKLGGPIIVEPETPPDFDGIIFPTCVKEIIVPSQSVSRYKKETTWGQFKILPQISIRLSAANISVEAPSEKTLTASVKTYGNCGDTVFWKSSNASVASVSSATGTTITVKALKPGTAVITARDVTGSVTATCKVTVRALNAPKVKAASAGYNKNKVTWTGVSGAAGYTLYRCGKSGVIQKSWSFPASARSHIDTGRATGTAYYYKVRAYKTVNGTRYQGDYSSVVSAKPVPAKVTGVKAKKGGVRKIKVTWKKVTGASGYTVARSLKKTKSYKTVKTVKSGKTVKYTTGKLKKGKRYYFKVRAYRSVKGKKVYGAYSSVVSYKAK